MSHLGEATRPVVASDWVYSFVGWKMYLHCKGKFDLQYSRKQLALNEILSKFGKKKKKGKQCMRAVHR